MFVEMQIVIISYTVRDLIKPQNPRCLKIFVIIYNN